LLCIHVTPPLNKFSPPQGGNAPPGESNPSFLSHQVAALGGGDGNEADFINHHHHYLFLFFYFLFFYFYFLFLFFIFIFYFY